MKKIAVLLVLGVFLIVSCEKHQVTQKHQVTDVSWTTCNPETLKSSKLSGNVEIEFTNNGVQIKYYDFEVSCDFTTVNVTHTFVNGVLNIIQQGSPNQANCICYTDVSYTINGISQNEVNVIFINGVQVYCHNNNENGVNKVLLLTVDYTTNTFKGGKELEFSANSETFTITHEYEPPCDFGHLKLFYDEINELLFFGTIHWMGCGKMEFPKDLLNANQFQIVNTYDLVYPKNGFENIFGESFDDETYKSAWVAIQHLTKVREYLRSNPEQIVKLFLYTPSVGCGNPEDWYWVIFLKQR